MLRFHERGQQWDGRFAVAVRWLISPHLKKDAEIPLDKIYPSLGERRDEPDGSMAFDAARAMLGV